MRRDSGIVGDPNNPSGADKIIIPGDDNTLQQAASYINSSNYGVTANVVTDNQGSRLVLASKTSGAAGNLTVTSSALNFTQGTAGVDAQLNVDGVPIDSSTNTVTSALPGVTLNLASGAPNTQVTISVGADTNQATQTINNFVSAYNTVISDINSPIALAVTGLQQTNQSLTNDINDFEVRMTSLQQELTQQYSAVNATREEYPMLMQQIASQLAGLPSSSKSS